jgi:two-component sensor histidine kinase
MTASADLQIADLRRRLLGGYQLLQALVGIRLRSVTDPESRRHMTWLSDVTAAMTLLNRRISDEGPVDFSAYLDDAAAFWRRSLGDRGIRIEVRAADALVSETQGLPLAIIVHELVSNAVRHAFPDGQRGSIAVAWSLASGGVSLVVRDSGVGAETLTPGDGLSLVEGLVEHLGGVMSIETAPGAGVGVRVRLPLTGDAIH